MQCNNTINILHNIAYVKQQCRNEFIMRSVLHNVNTITASILPKNANCNAIMIHILRNIAYDEQQCTNAFIYMYNVNAITVNI